MATQLPLRSVRIPALQRQCLFLRHQPLHGSFAAAASRTFSSTPSFAHKKAPGSRLSNSAMTRAAVENAAVGPSPTINRAVVMKKKEAMVEDIGLLQNTIVRAPFKLLPSVFSKEFRSYLWKLLKAKGTGLYSRSLYRRYIEKKGISRYLPMDVFKDRELEARAKHLYTHMHKNFNIGNTTALQKICLEPLARQLGDEIKARKMNFTWDLAAWKSARVVSHRVSALGDDFPNTAYRQAVIRLESDQRITMAPNHAAQASTTAEKPRLAKATKTVKWVPEEARTKQQQRQQKQQQQPSPTLATPVNGATTPATPTQSETTDPTATTTTPKSHLETTSGETQRVVDYLVLQIRVVRGVEDKEWKIWGFTEESTPELIVEDEAYFSKALDAQAAGAGL